jgi:hypothetical protein
MSSKVRFREVILPPLWLIAFIYFLLFSFVIAIWAAFGGSATIVSTVVAIILGIVAVAKSKRVIEVSESELRVGAAHIPLRYCGDVQVLASDEFMKARTRDADPAAYFALIFWISHGIKVEITDKRDSTPYWLISTKRGEELKRVLKG